MSMTSNIKIKVVSCKLQAASCFVSFETCILHLASHFFIPLQPVNILSFSFFQNSLYSLNAVLHRRRKNLLQSIYPSCINLYLLSNSLKPYLTRGNGNNSINHFFKTLCSFNYQASFSDWRNISRIRISYKCFLFYLRYIHSPYILHLYIQRYIPPGCI